jgi:hypothetical protein
MPGVIILRAGGVVFDMLLKTLSRLLNLWPCDHSMKDAVQLCFAFLPAIDFLTSLWPSESEFVCFCVCRARWLII